MPHRALAVVVISTGMYYLPELQISGGTEDNS